MSYGMTITVFPGSHANEFKLHIDKSVWEENRCVKSENILTSDVTTETQIPEEADTDLWMIPLMEYVQSVLVQRLVQRRDGRGITTANGREYFAQEKRSGH